MATTRAAADFPDAPTATKTTKTKIVWRTVYGSIVGNELRDVSERLDDINFTLLRHTHRVSSTRQGCRLCAAQRTLRDLHNLFPIETIREVVTVEEDEAE